MKISEWMNELQQKKRFEERKKNLWIKRKKKDNEKERKNDLKKEYKYLNSNKKKYWI